MNVIYDIITEDELTEFTDRDWELLGSLLDDTLAILIKEYLNNPGGNAEIQELCKSHIGDIVKSYTFHLDVVDKNIVALVREVQPETVLLNSPEYIAEVKEKFSFLRENFSCLRTTIPARKKQDWDEFYDSMSHKSFAGGTFLSKLKVNKSMFCNTRETDRPLPTKYIITVRSRWEMALNAILYDENCKRTGNMEYSLAGRLRFY